MEPVINETTLNWLAAAIADDQGRHAPEHIVAFADPWVVGIYAVRVPEYNYSEYVVNLNARKEDRVESVIFEKWPPQVSSGMRL